MLDKPEYGWSHITIGEWSDRCSYLDDVPYMLLEALEESCRTFKPVAVEFEAEGWNYIIIFNSFETHIISEREPHDENDGYKYFTVEVDHRDLAHELITDIMENLDDWAAWPPCIMSEDEYEDRKKDLAVMCSILERRL